MDRDERPEDERFRAEVRSWLEATLPTLPPPPDPADLPARRAYDTHWQRLLHDAGYARFDWDPRQHLVLLEESERAGAPDVGVNFVGTLHAGPTIAVEGTPAQRERYLGPILRGEEVWCQGFSEPQAGSDLAALRTRAVRDGDAYVVDGRKVWTSHAQVADLCELLVRTDPDAPKHRGISWLVLPMDTPGVEVRPMRTIAGSEEFSEVFLDDVRIPVENRVGEENDGWRVAMVTFGFERGTAFVPDLLRSRRLLADLAAETRGRGASVRYERELAGLAAELDALWALTERNVSEASRTGRPGIGGSIFKLAYSELRHRMGDLALEVLGADALTLADEHVRGWVHALSLTIAAGTSQVQRNIVGERILGLPKEPGG